MASLDPSRLDPVASVNRAIINGRTARKLLSAAALRELAIEAGLTLGDVPVRAALDAANGTPAFATVVHRFGERLSELLVALRSGDRGVRREWDDSWWARWASTSTVWLGGGLAGGAFGAAVAEQVNVPGLRVAIPPNPTVLPLAGAARIATTGKTSERRLVLDFGHTAVKRAVTQPDELVLLPPMAAPAESAEGDEVAHVMLEVLSASWAEAGRPSGPVVCAIAAYTFDGQPVRTELGTYARLADLKVNVQDWLSDRLGARVRLIHDGTAAACAVPPDPHSVVLLMGTSLGVGYPAEHSDDATTRSGSMTTWLG